MPQPPDAPCRHPPQRLGGQPADAAREPRQHPACSGCPAHESVCILLRSQRLVAGISTDVPRQPARPCSSRARATPGRQGGTAGAGAPGTGEDAGLQHAPAQTCRGSLVELLDTGGAHLHSRLRRYSRYRGARHRNRCFMLTRTAKTAAAARERPSRISAADHTSRPAQPSWAGRSPREPQEAVLH